MTHVVLRTKADGGTVSIEDYQDDLEAAAFEALRRAKAIEVCPFHSDVVIRLGDDDAERHAYALATTILKREGEMWKREDLMPAIQDLLGAAADGVCAVCENI